jgi:3-phosphoinositide dependent protein kinase-1
MPPECAHNKPTTRASDIWSLGCILYQLYTGLPPFRGASDYLIFRLSCEANLLKLDEYPESIMP